MSSAASGHIIFVIGMHRSGTSALCAALQACGVSFASDLLRPLAGVNEEGFWEAEQVVAINEELLRRAGASWYSLDVAELETDWLSSKFADLIPTAVEHLNSSLTSGAVLGVKDPRLCITFPFWQAVCERNEISLSICSTLRDPMAMAASLEKRDGFSVGYGLRLLEAYVQQMAACLPQTTFYIEYDELLREPRCALEPLLADCSLEADDAELSDSLNSALCHHRVVAVDSVRYYAIESGWNLDALRKMIEDQYPMPETLQALASGFVLRGQELTRIGSAHSTALATLNSRDEDVDRLGSELRELHEAHSQALAIIDERSHWYYPFKAVLEKLLGWRGMHNQKADRL